MLVYIYEEIDNFALFGFYIL